VLVLGNFHGGERLADLTILGSGTGVPTLRRAAPGLLLISESTYMLIDSGSGTLRRVLEIGMNYQDLDLLLYTHTHPDHVSDLVPILFANKYTDNPRQKDLQCIGGPGFKSFYEQVKKIHGRWIEPESYRLTIDELSQQPFSFRGLRISAKPMAHLSESIGYRIDFEDGKSFAVSGDTDYCRNIVDLGFEVDLLALECSFPDGRRIEGHLTPSLAGKIATESRCKRLLLIHFYPVCDQYNILDQCRTSFQGETILGEDFASIRI
jgi:ribonuclease BN (tRNA processing enzyme)